MYPDPLHCGPVHIRDPIHGAIEITADERALVDSPQYQRLRNVKQLGFADLAFPGATHTRYAHGLGAMAVATRVFDALAPKLELAPADRDRFRETLRRPARVEGEFIRQAGASSVQQSAYSSFGP